MTTARIELPPKLIPIFTGAARYRCAYGGRAGGKTYSFALMTAIRAYQMAGNGQRGVILCAREFMNSLDDSSLEEIKQAIEGTPWLAEHFDVGEKYIRTKCGRIRYVFAGLRHSLNSIKSKAKVLIAWIDEAESVSETAWQKLTPTIREAGSEVWVTWNREKEGSPVDSRFIKTRPRNCKITEINADDNPWLSDASKEERENDRKRLNHADFLHIWEGHYKKNSDAQIFNGCYSIEEFEPQAHWDGPYYGIDWGFANDPTAGTKSWISDRVLYIEHDFSKVRLELDATAGALIDALPDIERHSARADNARPESISYVKRHGIPRIEPCKKGKGSVEDGIEFIKSFDRIVIHPRCKATAEEFALYSYKVDRLSGDILTIIVDAYNHCIDSLRYALEPIMRKSTYSLANL